MFARIVGLALLAASSAAAATTANVTTFFNFAPVGPGGLGGPTTPHAGPIVGSDGNFYGTSAQGGVYQNGIPGQGGLGTIYRVTPQGAATTLHSFGDGLDGQRPASVLVEAGGFLYGTTAWGGANNNDGSIYSGDGTIFRIKADGSSYAIVHSFGAGANDGTAGGALVPGSDGALYGTTGLGGEFSGGTAYRLTHAGAYTTLRSFGANPGDGKNPGLLVAGADGFLYGLTYAGGAHGRGTFFRMNTAGEVTTLYSFGACAGDAASPFWLIQGPNGHFYGLSADGGNGDNGTFFAVSVDGIVEVLHRFESVHPVFGASLGGGLMIGPGGSLFGLTQNGGTSNPDDGGDGTLYRLSPDGAHEIVHSFVRSDGFSSDLPTGELVQGTDGALYGITQSGGESGTGIIFRAAIADAPTVTYPAALASSCGAARQSSSGSGAMFGGTLLTLMLGLALRTLRLKPGRTP